LDFGEEEVDGEDVQVFSTRDITTLNEWFAPITIPGKSSPTTEKGCNTETHYEKNVSHALPPCWHCEQVYHESFERLFTSAALHSLCDQNARSHFTALTLNLRKKDVKNLFMVYVHETAIAPRVGASFVEGCAAPAER
jgi:hypothetical protein